MSELVLKKVDFREGDARRKRHPTTIAGYLSRDKSVAQMFAKLRRHSAGLVGSSYDISRTCNLKCEGCLFFEGPDIDNHEDDKSIEEWDQFFMAERARGVNFPFFAGAEPALVPDRLKVAAKHFDRGVIFTNGTVKIDPALPFTIHVSIWGDEDTTEDFRGGNSFRKALRNFSKDPRARFVFTVNANNIDEIEAVTKICLEHEVKLSFSLFSPTEQYKQKLESNVGNDEDYFRISSLDNHLALTETDLLKTRKILDSVVAKYPDHLIYTKEYNHWVTNPNGLYDIDPETGIALNCQTRMADYHVHYRTDHSHLESKCCSPNIDCKTCRAYSMASGTAVSRFRYFLSSYEDFRSWVMMADQWAHLFVHDWQELD